MRALRFLNLLEPGKPVLSITKVMMWLSTILTVVVVVAALVAHFTDRPMLDAGVLLGALGQNFASAALYAWRRHVQVKTGSPGLRPDDDFDHRRFDGPSGIGSQC